MCFGMKGGGGGGGELEDVKNLKTNHLQWVGEMKMWSSMNVCWARAWR